MYIYYTQKDKTSWLYSSRMDPDVQHLNRNRKEINRFLEKKIKLAKNLMPFLTYVLNASLPYFFGDDYIM